MNQQLSDRITSLAVALLGNPPYKRPGEWRYGEKHHLLINVSGERQGYWYDFKTGEHGDALQLAQNQTGYKGRDLSNWVKSFIGYSFHKTEPKTDGNGWKPIIPVPFEVTGSKHYEHLLREFSYRGLRQTMHHVYRDGQGNLIGYVIRLEGNGRKMTLPMTYCSNAIGQKAWRWKGFPIPRLPYGVELLNSSEKPVLIVEGEKTADAARRLLPGWVSLSWVAGASSAHLTDWGCLKGRNVVLWPDNDEPGIKCMQKLMVILLDAGATQVGIVPLPPELPQKWDLADELPEGWSQQRVNAMAYAEINDKEMNHPDVCGEGVHSVKNNLIKTPIINK